MNKKAEWHHGSLLRDMVDKQLSMDDKFVWAEPCWPTSIEGYPIPDILTIRKSFSKPLPTIYEIKVNRSDFLSDVNSGKWIKYLPYCQKFFFAVPRGMVRKGEVPDGAGLILRSEKGWRVSKNTRLREYKPLPNDVMFALLFRHLAEIRRVRSLEERTAWMKNKKLSDKAVHFSSEIRVEIAKMERRIEDYKDSRADNRAVKFVQRLARNLGMKYEDVVESCGWGGLTRKLFIRGETECAIIKSLEDMVYTLKRNNIEERKKGLLKGMGQ